MKKEKLSNLNTYLIIALVIVVGVSLYFTLSIPITPKEAAKTEALREVTLTVLQGCEDCSSLAQAVEVLKKQPTLNITNVEDVSFEDAKQIADKYGITKLPALLIKGNISNFTLEGITQKEDALVFDQSAPPYYDLAEKRVKGKVALTLIQETGCTECFDMSKIIGQLEEAGIKITSETKLDAKSDEGKAIIAKYKIEKLPTIVFNKEALEYPVVSEVWQQVGTTEADGSLVLRFVTPPYLNVSTGKTEGLVELTYLVDSTCADCYNATIFKGLFAQSFNMFFKKEETVDVSSTKGKFLLKKYGIELLPTAILSKDAAIYPGLAQSWTQVGMQKEGAFVFTNIPLLGDFFAQSGAGNFAYKNLTSGEVIGASSANKTEEAEIAAPAPE